MNCNPIADNSEFPRLIRDGIADRYIQDAQSLCGSSAACRAEAPLESLHDREVLDRLVDELETSVHALKQAESSINLIRTWSNGPTHMLEPILDRAKDLRSRILDFQESLDSIASGLQPRHLC